LILFADTETRLPLTINYSCIKKRECRMAKPITLPENLRSLAKGNPPFEISDAGQWLILSDIHFPHSDDNTVESALNEAKRLNVKGILLNGDILDSAEISDHEKHRSSEKYRDEVKMGLNFLEMLRGKFKKARIIYKIGNHEERLDRYVITHAPALDGLEGFNLRSLLHMDDLGVELVEDRRVIRLGKLNVLHGHEFRGGGGVNIGRWLYLQCGGGTVSCCGHFHRTGEHSETNIVGFHGAAWGIGCACDLHPHWLTQNHWNHGFATVELEKSGDFLFANKRVFSGGRVY
jgi:predicted phosphodiesterase